MQVRDGTPRQKALFACLVGVYLFALGVTLIGQALRVGHPVPGVGVDGDRIVPLREDVARAGLQGGGRLHEVNGVPIAGKRVRGEVYPLFKTGLGETNLLRLQDRNAVFHEIAVPVRVWRWRDTVYATGSTMAIGAVFVLVGTVAFVIRPYDEGSWALLALCVVLGSLLTCLWTEPFERRVLPVLYFRALVGLISVVPLHAGLALPVVHPWLLRHRARVLGIVYGLGAIHAVLQGLAWYTDWAGPLRHMGGIDRATVVAGLLFAAGRTGYLAVRSRDPLVAQRARILVLGMVLGGLPLPAAMFSQVLSERVVVDPRLLYWTLSILILAIAYTTVRHDLVNARVAVRRAVVYLGTLGLLTAVALLLITVRPYAVALLLLSMLYYWPRFEARLDAWLYPQRAKFRELARALGEEFAACTTVDDILAVLAQAPVRLCETRSCVAFLFPGAAGPDAHLAAAGGPAVDDAGALQDEPLIQLLMATRQDIVREAIAVDPQYRNIQAACYACLDRFHADVLVPIMRDGRVAGGLALGPRRTEDPYEPPELDAIAGATQQAVQAIVRAEATATLRARELEFLGLKRFLSPHIIDQVMAKGGAAELRTQRKPVTVFFADLRGFTSFSDSVEPEEVLATLAEYHEAMGRRIAEFDGTLERFAGDGFMVFFNDPVEQPDHVHRAVRMALAMREDVAALREGWTRKGYAIDAGMGVHMGYATCGFVGYEGRRDYAVIGNVTNLAARLSDAAEGGEILISARVHGELGDGIRVEPLGELSLKGFHQPQPVFRVVGAGAPV